MGRKQGVEKNRGYRRTRGTEVQVLVGQQRCSGQLRGEKTPYKQVYVLRMGRLCDLE